MYYIVVKKTISIFLILDKNIKLLPQPTSLEEKYPEYKISSSKISDKYDKIVLEIMTCDDEKNEKY
jgi:hypothetical protein